MRTFVRLRGLLASNNALAGKLAVLERKYASRFKVVFAATRALMIPVGQKKKNRSGLRPGNPDQREKRQAHCWKDSVDKSSVAKNCAERSVWWKQNRRQQVSSATLNERNPARAGFLYSDRRGQRSRQPCIAPRTRAGI